MRRERRDAGADTGGPERRDWPDVDWVWTGVHGAGAAVLFL